ncbi:uncharacterized protein BDR25DRAFT_78121 [Lindgomyces ingoldianus]|uniref:Uncharacterized protein n=1 Tax=Lindgomyces ingoldianus TaxID=673940 RepID=A0ACB6QIT2_9PLEO|nr:uncharacterized protein BDR25DRAFT_78121 [Lindgomyces ingoldianus]KAF2466420.1 hypothetical protein BDR25DRAFT_78121 [Lindgomyces ingoldianus]
MAQVLAPIAQTTGSITMLHSSSDGFQHPQAQQPHHPQPRSNQMPRSQLYNTQNGAVGYRSTSSAPIAPYAFSSTPQLRQENRASSAPSPYTQQQAVQPSNAARLGHPSHPSSSSDSTVSTSGSSSRSMAGQPMASKDDMALASDARKSTADNFPASTVALSTSVPDLTLSALDAPVKPSPDRYRRGARRNESSNGATASSSTPTPTQQSPSIGATPQSAALKISSVPALTAPELQAPYRPGHNRANSADDMQLPRQGPIDQAKRYRRRSLSGFEASSVPKTGPVTPISSAPITSSTKRPAQDVRPASSSSRHGSRPSSSHERQGSAGSVSSNTSRPSSRQDATSLRASGMSPVLPPSRSSNEPPRRTVAPSPLSKPLSPSEPPSPAKKAVQPTAGPPSPAMQQLSVINDKESGKGMKSRLRRAFSFGSAAELRRASAENNMSAERAKLRKDKYQNQNEQDVENDAIIAKQEAAGIGAGIYSGQGGFSGSTDNLSISSTASSASIMLRKMGSGMKRGTRSIKGLFRPKSVIGVPAADTAVTQASVGQVSMVTVEAERQKVNVNADPHDQVGGGTGYPRLERNSLDAVRTASDVDGLPNLSTTESSRKSIVGGDRERAEVLSSMKKGILKRTGTSSGSSSPVVKPTDILHPNDSPKSSAPSTPNDEHARPVHVHINGEDYFGRTPRLPNNSTRSLPNTPHGSRNISFSPRLQFHDAWSSAEYDRRGDIATCNRLTPMLAQQIKEELNSFKMEMEVHEMSKPHTHFF